MAQACDRCSRLNPSEAAYCYFDGRALKSGDGAGPVNVAKQSFHNAFVLPSGRNCRNFDELAVACQQEWDVAADLLREGYLEKFLAGLGRTDLAMAARTAAAFPDRDRGLDQLLDRLPTRALAPPRLSVEPLEMNLGEVHIGQDRNLELHLVNQGMRLIHGSIGPEKCVWLSVGNAPGASEKLFQFGSDLTLPIHVRGKLLRAHARPQQGHVVIATNAGTVRVTVQVTVPIKPFPQGVLAGALSPRQVAQKAKAAPKEAAALFEKGAVAQWYTDNGWTYPVQGPAGFGLSAVQQFFEALGLVNPPRIDLNKQSISLTGKAGESLQTALEVKTQENRAVHAHAVSSEPWLEIGHRTFAGRSVTIPLMVREVPNRPGEILQASINVRANGNQCFVVPVALTVVRQTTATQPASDPSADIQLMPGGWGYLDTPAPVLEVLPADAVLPAPAAVLPHAVIPPESQRELVKPDVAAPGPATAFGMTRLVYWSSFIGGWSALLGWMVAELLIGRWVGRHFLLAVAMILLVAAAIGTGLSQVEALITWQWKAQRKQLISGLIGGLAGGLFGGLLGNLLYLLIGGEIAWLGFLGRVLGWTLLGTSIGICEGLLKRHWRRFRNGLIGGSIGGFLGGLFFNPVSYLVGSPVSSRAFAFVLLGLCIGLFVGLVQVLLKEAWVTVEAGFRPGRQLILNDEITTMGTSEKASLIFIPLGVKGMEPIHLRIRRGDDGAYILEDNASRGGTFLNGKRIDRPERLKNGDAIQFGVNEVRFHERYRPGRAQVELVGE